MLSTPVSGSVSPVDDAVDRKLDPRYIRLQRQVGGIESLIFGGVVVGGAWFVVANIGASTTAYRFTIGIAGVIAVARAIWGVVRPPIAYRYASYRVDANGVEIRRGIFWRKIINVPRSRVQHTDVSQGIFERAHGLGTLVIHTAGVHHAVVVLNGLEHGTALRLRDNLLPRGTVDVV